jgi:hypothetical protein
MTKSTAEIVKAEVARLRQLRAEVIKTRDRSIAQALSLRALIGSAGPRPRAGGKPLANKALLGLVKKDEASAKKKADRMIATIDRRIAKFGGAA